MIVSMTLSGSPAAEDRAARGVISCTPREAATLAAMRRRILAEWRAASADDLAAGLEWYARAERAAADVAPHNPTMGAAIIAALSPRNRWSVNVAQAARVALAAACGFDCPAVSTGGNRAKAWRIALGEPAADILRGPKVRAFFANITGDDDAVTVDVWAARAAEGVKRSDAPSGRRYALIARAYRDVADALGVPPRHVQAAVWCHVRGSAV